MHYYYLWRDSTIILAWIAKSSATLKMFVVNRVAQMEELTHNAKWLHVPFEQNPPDILSRGTTPKKVVTNTMRWNGPQWLITETLWLKHGFEN